jgi:hypothetical protein
MTAGTETLQALIDDIEDKEKERATFVEDHAGDLAPFGHRSANVKILQAQHYMAKKVGDKPPSDRYIDEMILAHEVSVTDDGVQDGTTRQLAEMDANIDAQKRRYAVLLAAQARGEG